MVEASQQLGTTTLKDERIAIVGGGIAGLYMALRLKSLCSAVYVEIFEQAECFGGRLLSIELPGVGMPVELGAMRYSSRHRLLCELIRDLNSRRTLPRQLEETDFNLEAEVFHLRGRPITHEMLRSYQDIPYNLPPSERGKLPVELVADALWRALEILEVSDHKENKPDLSFKCVQRLRNNIAGQNLTKHDWKIIKERGTFKAGSLYSTFPDMQLYGLRDIPFNDVGFWGLLQHFMSPEAYMLVHDGLGYESVVGNWNAAEAAEFFLNDWSIHQRFQRPAQGFQSIAKAVEAELRELNNVKLTANRKLESATLENDTWNLTFAGSHLSDPAKPDRFTRVILALPRAALLDVKLHGLPEDEKEKLRRAINAVDATSLVKFFLLYERAWWTDSSTIMREDSGRVFTDMPIRQVYHYGPRWIHARGGRLLGQMRTYLRAEDDGSRAWPRGATANDLALVMASYSDAHYASFWTIFSDDDTEPSASDDRYGPADAPAGLLTHDGKDKLVDAYSTGTRYGAPKRAVMKLQAELAQLHGIAVADIPKPIAALFKVWPGGWHSWRVRASSAEHQKTLVGGVGGLHVCGEAYSTEQGWVEGALKSVEYALWEMKSANQYQQDSANRVHMDLPDYKAYISV